MFFLCWSKSYSGSNRGRPREFKEQEKILWENIFLFQVSSFLSLGLGSGSSKLPGIILGDVSVAPDVEVVLLGVAHCLLIDLHQLFKLSTPLAFHKEESVFYKVLANVLFIDVDGHEGVVAHLVLDVQLDSLVQYVFPQNLHALGCKLFVLGNDLS